MYLLSDVTTAMVVVDLMAIVCCGTFVWAVLMWIGNDGPRQRLALLGAVASTVFAIVARSAYDTAHAHHAATNSMDVIALISALVAVFCVLVSLVEWIFKLRRAYKHHYQMVQQTT
jgi:uncharacterized membrane protein